MTPNPVSVEEKALVSEAVVLLTERGFSAAPVIDEAGRPIGVVSRINLLIHEREQAVDR
jgi:CBS domain-containing protein